MSLNTFSHTFHYVTHYTDPTIDINIPHSLHLTDTCRKLDFETCQDLHTNTRGSGDGVVVHMSWLVSLTVTLLQSNKHCLPFGKKPPETNGKTRELTQ